MAYTTIKKPSAYINTKLYTGTGSSQGITGVGFQPDFVWVKDRSSAGENSLFDAVRGVNKRIRSNDAGAETTAANSLTAFDADGFTVVSHGDVNTNSTTYASWNWKAGTTGSGSTTGSGTSKTYDYSVNTTGGFSITKYTGNGDSGHTIPHSLGTTPKLIMVKELSASDYWRVYHPSLTTNYNLYLNTTNAEDSASDGYLAAPDATNIKFGGSSNTNTVNQNNETYIAYSWVETVGYSKFGSYVANSNSNGNFVYLGFKPSFLMVKAYTGGSAGSRDWQLVDNKRLGYNVDNNCLFPNLNNAEDTGDVVDLLSNGFKIRSATGTWNTSGESYIYIAFASEPLVGDNPATAR